MPDWPSWVWILLLAQGILLWNIELVRKQLAHHHKVVIDKLDPELHIDDDE